MRLRLLTLAGLVLACVLVASGAATAAPASAADAHASASGKGKRTHHARHRHARKHKRKHRRRAAGHQVASTPSGVGGASTPVTSTTAGGTTSGGGTTTTTSTSTSTKSGSGSGSSSGSGAAAPTAVAASCPGASSQPTAANLATVRSATLCLVNQQRAAAGVGPLADNAALAAAAQGHSDDMVAANFFDHTNLAGASPFDRITAAGYVFSRAAENIAYGGGAAGTPAQIVGMWMNSSGHRANILDGALAESGIGVNPGIPGGGAGGTYTQDFGTR